MRRDASHTLATTAELLWRWCGEDNLMACSSVVTVGQPPVFTGSHLRPCASHLCTGTDRQADSISASLLIQPGHLTLADERKYINIIYSEVFMLSMHALPE